MTIISQLSIINEPSFVRDCQQFVIFLVNRLMYPDCPHRLYFVQFCNTTAVPVIHVGLKVDRKRSSSAEGIRNGTLIGQYCNRNALIKLVYTMWLLHVWWRHLAGCASVLRRDYKPSTSFFSNSCIWRDWQQIDNLRL